ncbi:DHA2 family efflux MFS transporter permease subunit [Mycobacteroides sp. LB1]|uniref:DHA2 family efflux MFS transporter permease subunit n=1 Tax=Mycobacteroides sp. LB1 TaxID=2750814 RepID=UPI0015DEC901|nr:DHA2 family efflux MFS transporter permease subunit [Mycobacteroides sp. LB1]
MDSVPTALPAPSGPADQLGVERPGHPDKLDAALLRIAGICGLASVMAFLDSTAVAVAQRTFVAEFGSNQAVVSWTIAGYMLAFATVIPMSGWAADRFGTKRLFLGAVLVFTVGSLLCAVAPNILLLIIFRVVQGIGGGMLMPLSFMILTREAGPKRLGRVVAIGAIPFLLGPIGGPILGGWLIGSYGWEWIFLINLPIGLSAFVLAARMFPADRPAPSEKLDIVGALLLSPGVATLLAGVSAIPGRDSVADRHVLLPVIIGVTLIFAFVVHTRNRAAHPLIDLRLFENRVVKWANITQFAFAATFVGAGLLIPSYFQVALHQTPMQSGMSMVAMGIGLVLTVPLAGVFMDRHGPGAIVLIGLPGIAMGLGIFTYGVARQADFSPILLAGLLIMGMGVGCTSTPLSAACVQSLAPSQVARGTTLLSVNDQVGGSVGASLVAVLLTNQFNRAGGGIEADGPSVLVSSEFAGNASQWLSHSYTMVFLVTVALAIVTIIPAVFLPRKLVVQVDA